LERAYFLGILPLLPKGLKKIGESLAATNPLPDRYKCGVLQLGNHQ